MPDKIGLHDVPDEVMEEIREALHNAMVALVELSGDGPLQRPVPMGSGTCVQLGDRRFILTAAHVWDALKNANRIMMALQPGTYSGQIPTESVIPHELWNRKQPERGPDLALLEIPEPHASSLTAKKLFLDLSRHQERAKERPPKTEGGLWVLTGLVGEWSGHVTHDEQAGRVNVHLEARTFFGSVHNAIEQGGYDYLEMAADTTIAGVPSTFGGLSGGGLWEVGLKRDALGNIVWDKEWRFWGVACWQREAPENQVIIRCHGPKSIFEMAWAAWGLS